MANTQAPDLTSRTAPLTGTQALEHVPYVLSAMGTDWDMRCARVRRGTCGYCELEGQPVVHFPYAGENVCRDCTRRPGAAAGLH